MYNSTTFKLQSLLVKLHKSARKPHCRELNSLHTSAFACHVKIQLDNNYHNRNVTRSIVINTADGQGQQV